MISVIMNLIVFFVLIFFIARQMKSGMSLSKQILIGLTLGVFYGLFLQYVYADSVEVIKNTLTWTNVVAVSYTHLTLPTICSV